MQVKVLQATHPDMIVGLSAEKLRGYYLLTELFVAMGSAEVVFESSEASNSARFYLVSALGACALRYREGLDRGREAHEARLPGHLQRAHHQPVHPPGSAVPPSCFWA